jgi:DNA mismatch repair protein MutS
VVVARQKPNETPLMKQFLEIKERHPDAIVFFRLGDFYEMFFDDAVVASRQLDLTLTTRDKGKEDAVPMCGVPHHSARVYIAKLVEAGFRVVICEQVEDPKLAKGLVRRDVTRIVTPGVMLDEDVLEPKMARYVAALLPISDDGVMFALAYLDVSTGEFRATEVALVDLLDELTRVSPREILCAAKHRAVGGVFASLPSSPASAGYAWSNYEVEAADSLRLLDDSLVELPTAHHALLHAAGTVLAYARHTQPAGVLPVARLAVYRSQDAIVLDEAAITNLELVETMVGRKKQGSLLAVLDDTVTAPGGRLLRRWLLYPLVDIAMIQPRLDAVAHFVADHTLRRDLRSALAEVADIERLAGRATLAMATPRDMGKLRDGLLRLPGIVRLLGKKLPALVHPAPLQAPELADLATMLKRLLAEIPPAMLKDGGVIRTGVDADIDECRRLADGGKDEILAIEIREQQQSGIASLKVRYNRVFGYFIEITKSHLGKVPARYVRKQTVATGERYVTPELAELERKVLSAEESLSRREAEMFKQLVSDVAAQALHLAEAAAALAVLDVVSCLAEVAAQRGYVRPTVDDGVVIDVKDSRHPVIESVLPSGDFVPNDCRLDADREQLLLITGPNMAGKSTYMRQVAQIVLMAQMGSYVPASMCHVGVCDRVFTRVGAADNLSRGDSTFMVEMRETSHILAKATRRSLVILDEVGRGTSTYDGVSLAWAVTEFLHDAVGARTLFATHYHELVALASSRVRIRNVSAAIRESRGEIVFLRRIVAGGANKSYGIDVARLAGLPRSVIARARQLLGQLEGGASLGQHAQLSLLAPSVAAEVADPKAKLLLDALATIDIDTLTPLAALTALADLRDQARKM